MGPFLASRRPIYNKKDKLLRCQDCKAVLYCGPEHRVADRDAHTSACNAIRKAQQDLDCEEQKLRNHPGLYVMDVLRLCRIYNMGVSNVASALFLRLDKHQECYDFVKWWQTCDLDGDYDWGDISLPYLNIKNADAFEPVDVFTNEYADLSHTVAITLIKIRLLRDAKSLQNLLLLGKKVPLELLDDIRGHLVGTIVAKNRDVMESTDQSLLTKKLEEQVGKLHDAVKRLNPYF